MTYEERIQAIAEEMAMIKYAESLIIYSHISHNEYIKRKKEAIELMVPSARIALKYIAEHVKSALYQSESDGYWNGHKVNEYLKEQGLIPEKEVSNDIQ